MAFPTAVNNQITDSVTQTNVKVVGESPAEALGNIYQTMSHSTGIEMQDAAESQEENAPQNNVTPSVTNNVSAEGNA